MELKVYKNGLRKVSVNYYTDVEEIPYHRYFIAMKLAGFAGSVGDSAEGIISDADNALKMLDGNAKKAKQFINNIKNRMHFVDNEFHLSLASAFPFIKSINGNLLKEDLSTDDCVNYARKYKNYIPLAVVKKKTKFLRKLKMSFQRET